MRARRKKIDPTGGMDGGNDAAALLGSIDPTGGMDGGNSARLLLRDKVKVGNLGLESERLAEARRKELLNEIEQLASTEQLALLVHKLKGR